MQFIPEKNHSRFSLVLTNFVYRLDSNKNLINKIFNHFCVHLQQLPGQYRRICINAYGSPDILTTLEACYFQSMGVLPGAVRTVQGDFDNLYPYERSFFTIDDSLLLSAMVLGGEHDFILTKSLSLIKKTVKDHEWQAMVTGKVACDKYSKMFLEQELYLIIKYYNFNNLEYLTKKLNIVVFVGMIRCQVIFIKFTVI